MKDRHRLKPKTIARPTRPFQSAVSAMPCTESFDDEPTIGSHKPEGGLQ